MATEKLSVDDISHLFEIEPGPNLDKEILSDPDTVRPFSDRCEDLHAVVEPEPVLIPESVAPVPSPAPVVTTEPVVEPVVEPESDNSDNPLGLTGYNLTAYNDLTKNYPQFCLYDGTRSFKGFYRHKVSALKMLLATFRILPLRDYRSELSDVRLDHQVGNATISPDVIRQKIDDVFMARTRVVEILSEALNQYPVWDRLTNMLSSKLWKEHESRGAHKRDALCNDHMLDMIGYVEMLKGFIDSAKTIDGFLKSASDGLSRQLSCVLIRHNAGISGDSIANIPNTTSPVVNNDSRRDVSSATTSKLDAALDELDIVPDGTVISEPQNGGALIHHDFGVAPTDDEFADIG